MRFLVPVRTINTGPNPQYFARGRGVTWLNYLSDQFTGLHAIVVPGTLRDSLLILDGLLELAPPGDGGPTVIITDPAAYSDQIFGLFWLLGYQFSPRLAGLPDQRFWRIDRHADYGPLDGLARHRINTELIGEQWEDILRVAGSLSTGTVRASELMRVLQGGGRPSRLGRAIAELGRIAKTLHLLAWIDSEQLRRETSVGLNRHESRHAVARIIFHGNGASCASPTAKARKTSSARSASRSTRSCSGTPNTSTTRSPSCAPPATRSPTRTSSASHRYSTSTSRCSATSPSPCPTSSPTGNAASYASSARPLSVRSCSVTTGRPTRRSSPAGRGSPGRRRTRTRLTRS